MIKNKYNIPLTLPSKVKQLILDTDSIDQGEEKQYWFDIWSSLSIDQQDRFIEILQTEKNKLDDLDKRYQEEINKLSSPFLKD